MPGTKDFTLAWDVSAESISDTIDKSFFFKYKMFLKMSQLLVS